ncbi:MAG: signal peptidase II [Christensenellaceae bacterium]|nr:signal peptidase II [Christensenellaceae bacterium]MEA5065870.1 signal peptidase II [Eubacteriales bacterium]MEA5069892.1 signal peptidase II [Christensenellaceae bacterium]
MEKNWWIGPAIMLSVDRLTKLWAERILQPIGTTDALPGLFRFTYARNTGAAFSMLSGNNWALALVNGVMIAVVLTLLFRAKGLNRLTRWGLLLVATGGLGNLIDRLVYGYVIDFIELTFMRFAVFNLADVLVSAGTVLAASGMLIGDKKGRAA